MAEIDTLQVKITANAQSAAASLKSLSNALAKVKSTLSGFKGMSHAFDDVNRAIKGISTSDISKLNDLTSALNQYADAANKIAGVRGGKRINKKIADALKIRDDAVISSGGSSKSDDAEKIKPFGERIKESWDKITTSISKARKAIKGYVKEHTGFLRAIGRIAIYRAIRSAIRAITEAFSEGLKNAYGFSKQSESFTRLADTLDRIKSITFQMTNQIGAFYGELKQYLMPAIEWLVDKIRSGFEYLTELFAALNGETTYLHAEYVAKQWDENIGKVKEYKHQLLGLDELNNLSAQKSGGSKADDTDYSILYKEMPVSSKLAKIAATWGGIKETLSKYMDDIQTAVIGAEIGIGAILLFSGASIPLGLGLLVHGSWRGIKRITEKWGELNGDVGGQIATLTQMVSGALIGIGAILAFSGANIPLGIGLLIAGAGIFAVSAAKLNWNSLDKKTQKKIATIETIAGGALLAIGAVLTFSGANIPIGLGMLAAGAVALGHGAVSAWDLLPKKMKKKISTITAIASTALIAIGALLAFSGANLPMGVGMIVAGGAGLASAIALNWDVILDNLKKAWAKIVSWWDSTVLRTVKKAVGDIERLIGLDLNNDGQIGFTIESPKGAHNLDITGQGKPVYRRDPNTGEPVGITKEDLQKAEAEYSYSEIMDNVKENAGKGVLGTAVDLVEDVRNGIGNVINFVTGVGSKQKQPGGGAPVLDEILDYTTRHKAAGGVVEHGSLFYAGEAGAEFVGNIGNTSAVANTGQMTDAIFKAAYMGMSKALKENGGGMNGYEPATMDDLFIAMKKKASNYNKRTGNPAFA